MEDNSKDAINALGATQEIVEEYLTLETIQSKMKAAIVAGADTNVTDEEAKRVHTVMWAFLRRHIRMRVAIR